MKSQLYKKVREALYILTFLITIVIRWGLIDARASFSAIVVLQILLVSMILLIGLLYFQYRYYLNALVETRYLSKKECLIMHLKTNICEAIRFSLWQLIIANIACFTQFSWEWIFSSLVTWSVVISSYIVIISLYTLFNIYNKDYYYNSFLICSLIIIGYRMVVGWWFGFGSYNLTYENIYQNYILILINVILIIIILAIFFRVIGNYHFKVNKKYFIVLSSLMVELISSILLFPYAMNLESYSLFNYLGVVNNQTLIISLLWFIPKIILLFLCFSRFAESYKMNYIFYAVRIENKRIWIMKIFLELSIYIGITSVFKGIIQCFFMKTISMNIIFSSILYFLYCCVILEIIILIYMYCHDESVFNFTISVYILLSVFIVFIKIDFLNFWILESGFFEFGLYSLVLVGTYLGINYLLNHNEYY